MGTTKRFTVTFAAAIFALAGCGGGDGGDDAGGDAASGSGEGIQIEAGDLYFEPESVSADAGEVEITLDNVGAAEHDVVIEEAGDTEVVRADGGASDTGSIDLEAGTYTFYCSIPGHRGAGMEGTLEVS